MSECLAVDPPKGMPNTFSLYFTLGGGVSNQNKQSSSSASSLANKKKITVDPLQDSKMAGLQVLQTSNLALTQGIGPGQARLHCGVNQSTLR